jgi:hypothetical protein
MDGWMDGWMRTGFSQLPIFFTTYLTNNLLWMDGWMDGWCTRCCQWMNGWIDGWMVCLLLLVPIASFLGGGPKLVEPHTP